MYIENLLKNKSKNLILLGLMLNYFLFYTNLVLDDGSSWSLVQILVFISIISVIKYKSFSFNFIITLILFIGFFFITLNEYISHFNKILSYKYLSEPLNNMVYQFSYIIPLIFLPTLIKETNFKENVFFNIILYATIFSAILNSYWNIKLDFSRALLVQKFSVIIIYDYCIIAISLISLTYSIQLRNRWSFLFITLSLINIILIVLHGSRGAWLGLPIALFFIYMSYYKTHFSQVFFATITSILLTLIIVYSPQSPIIQRIDQFKADTSEIRENNYYSSTGTRLSLWKFSIFEFKTAPFNGIGIEKFTNNLCDLKEKGVIPVCNPHAHNILLQEMATHGLLGLITIITIFLAPITYFISFWRKYNNRKVKLICISGIVFTTYIFICGLTDYFFLIGFSSLLFYLTIISLMSFSLNYKK